MHSCYSGRRHDTFLGEATLENVRGARIGYSRSHLLRQFGGNAHSRQILVTTAALHKKKRLELEHFATIDHR